MKYLKFLLAGIFFGIVLTKSEVISWFRIQEMFRFQSFHMYGIIGTAVFTGIISIQIIRRFNVKTIKGERVVIENKKLNKGTLAGGIIFGLGWAMTGACPGPLFAHLGMGIAVMSVAIISAIAGTWVYSFLRPRLPH